MYLKMKFMVGKQKRADTTDQFCAKAYIVTHVNNENIVIYHQDLFNEFGHCVPL